MRAVERDMLSMLKQIRGAEWLDVDKLGDIKCEKIEISQMESKRDWKNEKNLTEYEKIQKERLELRHQQLFGFMMWQHEINSFDSPFNEQYLQVGKDLIQDFQNGYLNTNSLDLKKNKDSLTLLNNNCTLFEAQHSLKKTLDNFLTELID